jgi:hypothetical protein
MGKPAPDIDAETLDEGQLRGLLSFVATARSGAEREVTLVTAEQRRRQILRYSAWMAGADAGTTAPWRVIGKVYTTTAAGEVVFDAMRTLWNQGFATRGPVGVRIPEPYGYVPALRLLLMEEATGDRLKRLVRKRLADAEHMRLLAAAMIKLHRSPSIFSVPFTIEDHLKTRCAGLCGALSQAYPDLADAGARIAAPGRETEARLGHRAFTLSHGDAHLGQFQVQRDRIWILDLDPLHLGDPAYDVAMVLVSLKQIEGQTMQPAYVHMLRDIFASEYFGTMGWDVASRVPVHEALIHLKRACNRLRWKNEPGWAERIPTQIRQSVACLDAWRTLEAPCSVAALARTYDRCPGTV